MILGYFGLVNALLFVLDSIYDTCMSLITLWRKFMFEFSL